MGRFFSGGRLFAFLGLIILLVVSAGISQRSRAIEQSWPGKFIRDGFSLISRPFYEPSYQIATFFHRLQDLKSMYEENAQLKSVANVDAALRTTLQEKSLQVQELKQMLQFKDKEPQFKLVSAQVTGRSPLSWNSDVVLSVGSTVGIRRNLPVLNDSGALIGRIVAVAQYSSTVSLLTTTDSTDGVSASILSPKQPAFGIVSGSSTSPGLLSMQFISQLSGIAKPGDVVVTSGLSDIYPRGLVIGKVQSFSADGSGITRSAVIVPAANMNYLDYVFVLVPKQGQVLS